MNFLKRNFQGRLASPVWCCLPLASTIVITTVREVADLLQLPPAALCGGH